MMQSGCFFTGEKFNKIYNSLKLQDYTSGSNYPPCQNDKKSQTEDKKSQTEEKKVRKVRRRKNSQKSQKKSKKSQTKKSDGGKRNNLLMLW